MYATIQASYSHQFQELGKMARGLQGNWRCFDHIIDVAYGRKGKLKHELLEVRQVVHAPTLHDVFQI